MRKVLKIACREFLDTVQTKMFLLSFLMVPLIAGIIWYTSKNQGQARKNATAQKIAITNLVEGLSPDIQSVFQKHNSGKAGRIELTVTDSGDFQAISEQEKDLVRKGKLDLYVVLDKDIASERGKMLIYTRQGRSADMAIVPTVQNLINQAVFNLRCRQNNVPPELVQAIRRWVPSEQISLDEASGKERRDKGDMLARHMVPFFFMFMMFMGIISQNQHMMTSVIEEKSSRIIEVLLSAVSPFQLLAGKIVGMGGVGLMVMGIWAATAVAAARWQGLVLDIPPRMIVYFVLYYVLGFLLITSILAAIGSVCNTLKDAQSLIMPIMLLLILPMVSWPNILQDPNGAWSRVLSFVPLTAPMVMILRLASGQSIAVVEILASLAILGASVPAAIWAGGKIFRTGILLYGKRPSLIEMVHWLRSR